MRRLPFASGCPRLLKEFAVQRSSLDGKPELGLDRYVGVDIVPAVIQALQDHDRGDAHRSLSLTDLTRDPLPHCDLILSTIAWCISRSLRCGAACGTSRHPALFGC